MNTIRHSGLVNWCVHSAHGVCVLQNTLVFYERVGSSNPAWDLSLTLSFFQVLSSVSAYNNSKFVYHKVFDRFSEVVVSSKISQCPCTNGRKLYLLFGFLLPASCPLLVLGNGMVTYTDPPIDCVHNSFTATHTCSNGYL